MEQHLHSDKERNGGLVSPAALSLSCGVKTWRDDVKTSKGVDSTERFCISAIFASLDLHTNLQAPLMYNTQPGGAT